MKYAYLIASLVVGFITLCFPNLIHIGLAPVPKEIVGMLLALQFGATYRIYDLEERIKKLEKNT
jgi:hypothetical protein